MNERKDKVAEAIEHLVGEQLGHYNKCCICGKVLHKFTFIAGDGKHYCYEHYYLGANDNGE